MEGSEKRREFSWGRAIVHWLLSWVLVTAVLVGAGLSHGIAEPHAFIQKVAELPWKLFLPAVGISYLVQAGQRGAALGVSGVMGAFALLGFMLSGNHPPPAAELEKDFKQACTSSCPEGTDAERCSAFCSCAWDGIRTTHPSDGAVAEFFERAGADRSELERLMTEFAQVCAARVPAP
jgi:hypothetical protein